jgi:hypothetical protein
MSLWYDWGNGILYINYVGRVVKYVDNFGVIPV